MSVTMNITQTSGAVPRVKRPSFFLLVVAFWTGINSVFYFMLVPFRIAMSNEEERELFGNDWAGAAQDFWIAFLWLVLAVVRIMVAVERRGG